MRTSTKACPLISIQAHDSNIEYLMTSLCSRSTFGSVIHLLALGQTIRFAHSYVMAQSCLLWLTVAMTNVEALPATMGNWSPVLRKAAAKQAAKAGPAALPELLVALGSENPGMRHSSTQAIAQIARNADEHPKEPWEKIITKLISILNDDRDFWTRCGAAEALKQIRSETAGPALLKAASDPDPWVAAAAVDAISGMPVRIFDPEAYMATALKSLSAPRSKTRSGGIKMLGLLGAPARKVMSEVEASVGTLSQDTMFADRPRIEAIVWISRYDRKKAAALANSLLLEERWGAAGRQGKLVAFLGKIGKDAAPAAEGLKHVAARNGPKDKANATRARKILALLNS
jgi:HEAT repeats